MKYALYINNEVVLCSTNKHECIAKGVEVLTREWACFNSNSDTEQTENFLDIMCDFTYKARSKDSSDFYAECNFGDKHIVVKPFQTKTYEITYKITFEKDAIPNDNYFFMEHKAICYEERVEKVMCDFREELERNVENDLSIRWKTFDDMLGKEVDCLQDERYIYDVVDNVHKKYHTITCHEVKLN